MRKRSTVIATDMKGEIMKHLGDITKINGAAVVGMAFRTAEQILPLSHYGKPV